MHHQIIYVHLDMTLLILCLPGFPLPPTLLPVSFRQGRRHKMLDVASRAARAATVSHLKEETYILSDGVGTSVVSRK